MKKIIEKGYINFSEDVENNSVSVIKTGYSKSAQWASIITDYGTKKDFKRNYIDFEDYEIESKKVKVGCVLNLRKQIKESCKYCLQYDGYFLITKIDDNEITLEEFQTVSGAVKAQNKFSSN